MSDPTRFTPGANSHDPVDRKFRPTTASRTVPASVTTPCPPHQHVTLGDADPLAPGRFGSGRPGRARSRGGRGGVDLGACTAMRSSSRRHTSSGLVAPRSASRAATRDRRRPRAVTLPSCTVERIFSPGTNASHLAAAVRTAVAISVSDRRPTLWTSNRSSSATSSTPTTRWTASGRPVSGVVAHRPGSTSPRAFPHLDAHLGLIHAGTSHFNLLDPLRLISARRSLIVAKDMALLLSVARRCRRRQPLCHHALSLSNRPGVSTGKRPCWARGALTGEARATSAEPGRCISLSVRTRNEHASSGAVRPSGRRPRAGRDEDAQGNRKSAR